MQAVINYIEEHLQEGIEYQQLAQLSGYSTFYLQRIFTMTFGLTIGEYIRNRRLSEAARRIIETDTKILDIAITYGYQTVGGFNKAFKKYHQHTPTTIKYNPTKNKYLAAIQYNLYYQGKPIYYTIVEKPAFTIRVLSKIFTNDDFSFVKAVKNYWKQMMNSDEMRILEKERTNIIIEDAKYIGIDIKYEKDTLTYFNYGIGVEVETRSMQSLFIPVSTWLVLPCIGPATKNIEDMWKMVYQQLLQINDWVPKYDFNLEVYYQGDPSRSDYKCEFWIPVEKRN